MRIPVELAQLANALIKLGEADAKAASIEDIKAGIAAIREAAAEVFMLCIFAPSREAGEKVAAAREAALEYANTVEEAWGLAA